MFQSKFKQFYIKAHINVVNVNNIHPKQYCITKKKNNFPPYLLFYRLMFIVVKDIVKV